MITQRPRSTNLLDRVRGPFAALAGVALLVSGGCYLVAGEFSVPSRLALGVALLFFGMYIAIDPGKARHRVWLSTDEQGLLVEPLTLALALSRSVP